MPYFWRTLNFILWDGRIKFSSWLKGKCFDMGNGIRLPHYQVFCYVAKMLSRCVQQDETGSHDKKKNSCKKIHSMKRTRSRMRLFACSWCSKKFSLANHVSKFRAFCRSVFPIILEPGTGLFILEGTLSVLWKWKYGNILPLLFAKAFGPSNSTFLPVFHALTVCDTASLPADHRIAIERNHYEEK